METTSKCESTNLRKASSRGQLISNKKLRHQIHSSGILSNSSEKNFIHGEVKTCSIVDTKMSDVISSKHNQGADAFNEIDEKIQSGSIVCRHHVVLSYFLLGMVVMLCALSLLTFVEVRKLNQRSKMEICHHSSEIRFPRSPQHDWPFNLDNHINDKLHHQSEEDLSNYIRNDQNGVVCCRPGESGPKGPRGFPGYPGPIGFSGSPGYQGSKGEKGSIGPPGLPGTEGDSGPVGKPGSQGQQGYSGLKGLPGTKGDKGDQGSEGPAGPLGHPGLPGSGLDFFDTISGEAIVGPPGKPGKPGTQGRPGPQGKPGIQGYPGVKGDRGEQGLTGQQGSKGDKGDMGVMGLPGATGVPGEAAEQIVITRDGVPGLPGPKGDRGQKGDQGVMGLPGPEGIHGLAGETGLRGQKGKRGRLGIKGEKGEQGSPGLDAPCPIGQDGLPMPGCNWNDVFL